MTTTDSEGVSYLHLMREEGWLCTLNYSYTGEPTWMLYRDVSALLDMMRGAPEFGDNQEILDALSTSDDLAASAPLSAADARGMVARIKELSAASRDTAEYFEGPFTFEELLRHAELAELFRASREDGGLPPVAFGADLDATEAFLRGRFEVLVW